MTVPPAPGAAGGARPDPIALVRALRAHGLPLDVEADGALAILVPTGPLAAPDAALRRQLVALARDAGFTHVALELLAPTDGADAAG